jgi:hypothetical protein
MIFMFSLFLLGCVAEPPRAASSPLHAAAQPSIESPVALRTWVSFDEVRGKTLDEIRAMNIGCFYILKPEKRQESMVLLFEIHQRVTGNPYLATIVENWMKPQPSGVIDRGNQLLFPTCEDGWQFGDLNADGIVNMEDFAMYASVK